ncbi:hypothetical protein ACJJTC_007425 [Scirpophaga incertulas]
MEVDGEIEYLDEDAELVQQCVIQFPSAVLPVAPIEYKQDEGQDLLVQRVTRSKKRKIEEKDSDYDPNEDSAPVSPVPAQTTSKKKKTVAKKTITSTKTTLITPPSLQRNFSKNQAVKVNEFIARKNMDIHIPDYDDPLCLPVRAVVKSESAHKTLKNWNNLCIERLRQSDRLLRPEKGDVQGSKRTVVVRKVNNKLSGETDVVVWSKTTVENNNYDRKSDIFQSVLPTFTEKKTLSPYSLVQLKKKSFKHQAEIILSKESNKDGDILVAYSPDDALSAIYKMYHKKTKEEPSGAGGGAAGGSGGSGGAALPARGRAGARLRALLPGLLARPPARSARQCCTTITAAASARRSSTASGI